MSQAAIKHARVTVVLPVFNAANYLAGAIESILEQDYSDFKLLVIDDASADESGVIAREFSLRDPRVEVLSHKQNVGPAVCMNEALAVCRGDYVARMDADDVAFPNRLGKQVRFLDERQDIDVLGCAMRLISADGSWLGGAVYPETHEQIRFSLLFGSAMGNPSTMLRMSTLRRLKVQYDSTLRTSEDYDFWCRLIDRARFHNVRDTLVAYRCHPLQTSAVRARGGKTDMVNRRYREAILPGYRAALSRQQRWRIFCALARAFGSRATNPFSYAECDKDRAKLRTMLSQYLDRYGDEDHGLVSLKQHLIGTRAESTRFATGQANPSAV